MFIYMDLSELSNEKLLKLDKQCSETVNKYICKVNELDAFERVQYDNAWIALPNIKEKEIVKLRQKKKHLIKDNWKTKKN